jgi:hypothetical protein
MVLAAYRERCEREQTEALRAAEKWGESPAMALLFRRLNELELASDEAMGVEGGEEIAQTLSRACADLEQIAESARDAAIQAAVSACEFVDESSEPDVGCHGRDADEQMIAFRDELERDVPKVADLARRARRARD